MTVIDYLRLRLFEIYAVGVMLGMAVTLLFAPGSIEASAFRGMVHAGLSQSVTMIIFFVLGSGRAAALIVNGRSPIVGPWARAIGAALGVVMWTHLANALFDVSVSSGKPMSAGVACYAMLGLCEIVVASLAVQDASNRPG